MTTLNVLLLIVFVRFEPAWPLYIVAVFFGLFMIPILPTSYALAIEVTHPLPPPLVNGMMTSIAYILALILTQTGSILGSIFTNTAYPILFTYVFLGSVSVICSLFVQEDLRRSNENQE